MKKLQSTLPNMVIVLVVVAIASGALLAWVNNITKGPVALQAELALANGIKSVLCQEELTVTANDTVVETFSGKEFTFIVHKANDKSGQFIGAAIESTVGGFGGDVKVLVGFDAEGTVLGYTILQSAETPGLGAKADKWFQKDGKGSIIGRKMDNANPLKVKNDDGDVDAITASTITSRAFLKAVNQAYVAYEKQNSNAQVDGQSGATKQSTDGKANSNGNTYSWRKRNYELLKNNYKWNSQGESNLCSSPWHVSYSGHHNQCHQWHVYGIGHYVCAHLLKHSYLAHQEPNPRQGTYTSVRGCYCLVCHAPSDAHKGIPARHRQVVGTFHPPYCG